jgi:peptidyl-prolyl cis-trans isomerase SurA
MPFRLPRPAILLAALLAAAASLLPATGPARAQQALTAAAVVNDTVISVLDLEMRVRLTLLSANLPDSRASRQRISPQVMRSLIDETLQRQEAERLGYEVTEDEVQKAVARVANNNNMQRGQFLQLLQRNNILPQVFYEQMRATIAWQKILQRRLQPNVDISDSQVDEVVERLRARQGETEYQVQEIFLSVDGDTNAAQVRDTGQRLVQNLRGGAQFSALARQFSQSATAAVGGEIGWVLPDNLPESVANAVTEMQPGQIAGPLKGFNGFHIVKLTDKRTREIGDRTVTLYQLFHPLSEDADAQARTAAREQLSGLAEGIDGCGDVPGVADGVQQVSATDLGQIQVADLPGDVRDALAELEVDSASAPLEVNGGVAVLTLCNRSEDGIDRERIRQRLVNERLEMMAQRYMRDLRRQAHVDIRLGRAQR